MMAIIVIVLVVLFVGLMAYVTLFDPVFSQPCAWYDEEVDPYPFSHVKVIKDACECGCGRSNPIHPLN